MTYLLSFFVCGFICVIGQVIYDNTKFTPGHITSLFLVTYHKCQKGLKMSQLQQINS